MGCVAHIYLYGISAFGEVVHAARTLKLTASNFIASKLSYQAADEERSVDGQRKQSASPRVSAKKERGAEEKERISKATLYSNNSDHRQLENE